MAPAAADCITLDQSVTVVRDTTFAGTTSIGGLEIFDGIAFETDGGVFGDCAIGSIRITGISGDSRPATFSMDFGHGGIDALKDGLSHGSFDARTFAEAYDRIIGQIPDGLTQARLVIGRLASPVHMAEGTAKRFRAYASSQLAAISIAFGQRGEFHLFELMADAGVLDAARIDVCASALSAQGDASALGYLLDMKRRRFKKASWDEYGI